jgi:murein DD-endopeptidase MepM/ murein hydrolase activator NlpD
VLLFYISMMKTLSIFFAFCLFSLSSVAQLSDTEIHNLKGGSVKPDTSFIYSLPFAQGSRFLLIQGYNSSMSHKNEISLDFKMKKASKVCAARAGVVTSIEKSNDKGGLKNEYLFKGNHIIITHNDGSQAMYWHLQKDAVLVNEGDTVLQGALIGYSGNTGYTAFPHLHFQVYDKDGKNIATRFYTKKGIIYLRPGKWYKQTR